MMKLFRFFIVFLLFGMVSSHNMALAKPSGNSESSTVDVTVKVLPIFHFQVTPEVIDFGELEPTETSKNKTIQIRARSNAGKSVTISQKGENFSSGSNVVEIENVVYEIKHIEGTPGVIPHGEKELTETYEEIYKSTGNPHEAIDVTLDSVYNMTIPEIAVSGIYNSIFTITMTE